MRAGAFLPRLFGLSRMTHSVLDVSYLAVGALLARGALPPSHTIALGLLSAFAGLTAIFGLNDLLDRRVDTEKMRRPAGGVDSFDLDSLGLRHPIAQGKLSAGAGVAWVASWSALSFATAWLVAPACAWLLLAAALLEVGYCSLLRVTPWKTFLSGANVGVGGLAGLYAVSAAPSPALVAVFFTWSLAWEMGCRNIPNDWTDYQEDVSLGIRTLAVRLGLAPAARISFAAMTVSVGCAAAFPLVCPRLSVPVYELSAAAAAAYFLVAPCLAWQRNLTRASALAFFNRACFYPLAVFAAVVVAVLLQP